MNARILKLGMLGLVQAAVLVSAVSAAPQVLYNETFTGATGNVVDYGWRYYVGYNDTTLYDEVSWAGVASVNTGGGYVFVGGGGSGNETLFYTDEYSIDRSQFHNLFLSWTNEGDSASEAYRAAVKIGGQWYASSTPQSVLTGPLTFSMDSEMSLLDVSTSGISLLAATPLPTGNIDAFGMLFMNQIGNARYDNVLVRGELIPEPAAATLAALAALGALVRRRQ